MLRLLLEQAQNATSFLAKLRLLQEIAAYVMHTGPRGGRFYYTPKGRKVYRELKRIRLDAVGEDGLLRAWGDINASQKTRDAWDISVDSDTFPRGTKPAEAVATISKAVFGDKANSFTPGNVRQMFSSPGLVPGTMRVVAANHSTRPSIKVAFEISDTKGKPVGTMTRLFKKDSEGNPMVYHSFFELKRDFQGGGRAGALFGQGLKGYQKLGVKKIGVSAGLTAGPYTWARFGFDPDDDGREKLKQKFTRFASKRLPLTDKQIDAVLKKVKSVRDLSSLKIQRTVKDPDTGEKKKITIPVGKHFLLYGNGGDPASWKGVCDLTNPKQVKIFKAQCKKGEEQRKKAIAEGKADAPVSDVARRILDTEVNHWKNTFAPTGDTASSKLSAQQWYENDKKLKEKKARIQAAWDERRILRFE